MSEHGRGAWHTMTLEEVEETLRTNRKVGLDQNVCRQRLARVGRNELFLSEPVNFQSCARVIFSDTSLLILTLICLIALCFGRYTVSLTILSILLVNCLVVIWAYIRSNHIKESLCNYSAPRVKVIRGGKILWADAAGIVPGDVLLLAEGDIVPCDARLIENSIDFQVLTCVLDAKSKESFFESRKDATMLYDASSPARSVSPENMVFAGSVIHAGSARAIATETGRDTFLGSVSGPHCLARNVGEAKYISQLEGYMNRYSLWMCALILPLTLIGIFAGRGQTDILDVLLLALSLAVSSMSEQLLTMGRIVCACGILRASLVGPDKNTAIIKQYSSIEKLGRVDELFLFGRTALSDGELHPYAVYTSDRLFHGNGLRDNPVYRLFEIAYWYEKGIRQSENIERNFWGISWANGLTQLGKFLNYDTESLDVRALSLTTTEDEPDHVTAVISRGLGKGSSAPGGEFLLGLRRITDPNEVYKCHYRVVDGKAVEMSDFDKRALFEIFEQFRDQGTEVVAYLSEQNGRLIFEGIISYREAINAGLEEMRRQLERSSVRISLFFEDESEKEINYLLNSGWISSENEILKASDLALTRTDLPQVFDEKRVFLGFGEDEILGCFERCKQEGRTTACLGLRHSDAPMMNLADVCFTCETRTYSSGAYSEENYDSPDSDGCLAGQCDQTVRRNSDVLIRRAGAEGGGLAGILNAIRMSRSILFRMMLALQYLLVAQFLRITLVALPLMFGKISLSPMLLLISGIWIDLGYILVCAFHHCDDKVLETPNDYKKFFKSPLRSRPDWICASIATGLLVLLLSRILSDAHLVAPGNGQELFIFLSLVMSQTCLLICLLRTAGPFGNPAKHASSALIFFITLCLIAAVVLFPPTASLLGCTGMNFIIILFSFLAPVSLLFFYYLFRRFRRPVTQKIRDAWENFR